MKMLDLVKQLEENDNGKNIRIIGLVETHEKY